MGKQKWSSCCGGEQQADETERGNWSGKCDALLSYIGYCVGLGNVWRFPYLCYRNGGGAFIIPYIFMLGIAGLPLYFLELAIGQYASLGPSEAWAFCPLFKGIGFTAVVASALCCFYYNVIIAYILYYLFASFTTELPWATCGNAWNTDACVVLESVRDTINQTANATEALVSNATGLLIGGNETSYDQSGQNASTVLHNVSAVVARKTAAEEYWENQVLELSPGIEYLGKIRWQLALCLLLAWVIVFFCLIKGIKSTGKVVYVTATFPYIVLTILLIRGVTLEGAGKGLLFYLVPKWDKLLTPKVWGDAASQIFYSLGPAWGILITYGSYNRFNSNSRRDAVISALTCVSTSLFAGLVIFSFIGFMSHELGKPIEEVMQSGPGLVFIVYPSALTRMPWSPLWSIIFFLMLLTIALDSMFATFETFLTSVIDEFPKQLTHRRVQFTAVMCVVYFILTLPQVTQGGIYLLTLQDWYVGTFPPMVVGFGELVVISYIYGYKRFANDIQTMLGTKPNYYWMVTWMGLAPVAILFIIIFNAVIYTPVAYGDYQYPKWGEWIGWLQALVGLACIPVYAIYILRRNGGSWERAFTVANIKTSMQPSKKWRPAMEREREAKEAAAQKLITVVGDGEKTIPMKEKCPLNGEMNGNI